MQMKHVNVYVIGHEDPILIDTGADSDESYNVLLAFLREHDIKYIDNIYLTHGHIDHYGAAKRLIDDGIAKNVYAHKNELSNISRSYDMPSYAEYLKQYGIPEELFKGLKDTSSYFDTFAQIPLHISIIETGTKISYDGGTLEVIHTPGHTKGCVCFYDKDKRIMFSGDTLLSRLSPNPLLDVDDTGGRRKSLVEYIGTLNKLYNMDIEKVYPGHFEIINDHKAIIQNLMNFHFKRMMRIHKLIKDKPATPYDIMNMLFKNLKQQELFLGISEVVGHLDLLEEKEMVTSFEQNGLVYYTVN